ncbi:MAG: type II secretion system F family protein [Nitrosomonadales bacterium]|nr:type II secretion system F family protein [Nitrosomonadales bacterium]
MTRYAYKAMDAQGRLTTGWQDAADQPELARRLQQLGLMLIRARIRPVLPGFGPRRISRRELITLFLNLGQLSRAGVPLLDALGDLRDSLDGPLPLILASVLESIVGGQPLSQAMAQHPTAFDPVCISLIRAGEESGRLPEVFDHLATSLKWQDELAAYARNILLYPAFVGSIVLAITAFLMGYLVPQLAQLILSLGQTLPLQTRLLLATSELFVHYWALLTGVPLAILLAGRHLLAHRPDWQYRTDRLKLRLWLIGPILRKIILARFAHTFAMLYASGISVLDSLELCQALAGNRVIERGLTQVALSVESGRNLTQAFQQTGLFPPLVLHMLQVGEATGNLDQSLLNVSYFYNREVQDAIRRIQTLAEPALTLALGVLLGWVMLAVLIPIYDIISQVKL